MFESDTYTNGGYACKEYTSGSLNGPWTDTGNNCYGRTSDISFGGAAWYIDKHHGEFDKGWAQLKVKTKQKDADTWGKTAIALGKYGHDKSSGGYGLGVSIGYVSISYSGTFDDAATQTSWTNY
ncbi:hypothetical protein [Effusibacillus consociatus]|uniref:Uncharacterized protein n=1 Tax=Effusibacillus consociatus TaxID=1117041 RepID=A0ABV9Q0W1_9BACL